MEEQSLSVWENFSLEQNNTNSSDYFGQPLYSPPLQIVVVLSLFYGAISLVAVLGNSTVILIVLTSRRMQKSVTNFFIANLALADVIIGLFAIPFQFQAALLQRWNLPEFLCPFCPFFQNLSVNASIFTLTAIAVDRYKAIMFPLKSHASKSRTKVIILIIWIVSAILAVPMAIAFRANMVQPDLLQCIPTNIELKYFMWYKNFLCLVQYFIPLILISGAYIRMAVALWSARTPGAAQLERDIAVMNNKKKVIKMLMVVVALFTLAWLPLQVYDVLNQIFVEINYYPYINIIWFCCHWLAMSNSCYNPFIYLLCNEKFKKELRFKLSCCFGRNGPRLSVDYTNTMIWRNGRTDTTICRSTTGRRGKLSMEASEVTRSPSCGPNNLLPDSKQYCSPCPSYLSLHQTTSEEYKTNMTDQNHVLGTYKEVDLKAVDTEEKEGYKQNNNTEKVIKNEQFNKLENGNCDL